MPGIYSHNKDCDKKQWAGEAALGDFEEFIFLDSLMEVPALESYEEALENFWPAFIEDNSLA